MKRMTALLLCLGLSAPGCAAHQGARMQVVPQPASVAPGGEALADFARQLPPGSRVRAKLTGNRVIRGTLLKTTDVAVVIQPRTRVPEPLVEVPLGELLVLEQETNGNGVGKAIAIGASAGAAAALGVLLIIFAVVSD
jgi:hypothetical protein